MHKFVFILINILTISSSCSETPCEKASKEAINDFNAGHYSLHSGEVLPVDNAYFYVLREHYNINWYFTDSLGYYRCYDSTMLMSLDKKYQIDVSAKASKMADSLERTPNWRKAAAYPGGTEEVVKYIVKNIKTDGLKINTNKETRVFIQFIVDKSGRVHDPKIVNGEINESTDKQILDILSSTRWTPEYQYGKPIDTRVIIPIKLEFEE
jgi:hypothetical protein